MGLRTKCKIAQRVTFTYSGEPKAIVVIHRSHRPGRSLNPDLELAIVVPPFAVRGDQANQPAENGKATRIATAITQKISATWPLRSKLPPKPTRKIA